jgi:phosphatidate cytidylyltransferase
MDMPPNATGSVFSPELTPDHETGFMLKERIITTIVLLAAFLAALFYLPQLYWAGLMALVAAVAAWEWGAFAGLEKRGCLAFGGMALCLCLGVILFSPGTLTLREGMLEGGQIFTILNLPAADSGVNSLFALIQFRAELATALMPTALFYFLAACFWLLVAPSQLWRPQGSRKGERLFLGILLILATWFALAQLRAFHPVLLLTALGIAWVSDIAAYFAERKFGRRKLASTICPGKTWAGVFGGLAGVLLYGTGVIALIRFSDVTNSMMKPGLFTLIIFLLLAVWGMIGDLFVSLLKRQAGVKDSGDNIPPGHGGALARIGSLTAVLPCFAFLFVFWAVTSPVPRKW